MKNLINSLFILMPVLASAQDVLYKTDNSKQEVQITEIGETIVKYKAFSNLNGPIYTINKTDVALIVYENGTHEAFKTSSETTSLFSASSRKEKRFLEVTKQKNVIFLNTVEFLNSGIGVSYLREFCEGRLDLHIPFAASYSAPGMDNALSIFGSLGGYKFSKTNYDIGLGLYFNTSGKKAVTHFIGPLIRNAQYSGSYYSYNYNNGGSSPTKKTFTMNETSMMINNGFLYRITPRFNMMLNVAVGTFVGRAIIKESNDSGPYPSETPKRNLALHAGFHFGYRF